MARNNIQDLVNGRVDENVSEVSSAVRYDRIQIRSEEEKALARQNIGCFCEAGGGGGSSSGGGAFVVNRNYDETDTVITLDKTAAEIFEAVKNGLVIVGDTLIEGDQGRLGRTEFITNARKNDQEYMFITIEASSLDNHVALDFRSYYAVNDNDYPSNQVPSDDPSPT